MKATKKGEKYYSYNAEWTDKTRGRCWGYCTSEHEAHVFLAGVCAALGVDYWHGDLRELHPKIKRVQHFVTEI
jgi:hypothetical protein